MLILSDNISTFYFQDINR